MSLFDNLGNQKMEQERITPQQAVRMIQKDPAGVLRQAGINIPSGMTDPQQIVNHIIQSGQRPQNRLTQIMQMMGRR